MTSTETPGTRVSESGPNDGNELPSPLSVAHVTGSPEEGIVMARRTNDEQEPQAQVEETEAPGTELETEAPAEVESTEPEAPAEDEESEDEEGEEDEAELGEGGGLGHRHQLPIAALRPPGRQRHLHQRGGQGENEGKMSKLYDHGLGGLLHGGSCLSP